MSLWDPDAAGNAAKYLRLPEEEMLQIRNMPFIGGNAVWIPSPEKGYVKAELLGDADKAGHSKVMRADHTEKVIANDKIEKQNPPKYELLEGMNHSCYESSYDTFIQIWLT